MHKTGLKTMKDFAAEIGINRSTVSDVVSIHALPTERIGNGKCLSPTTQRAILKILGITPARTTATATV